MDIICNAARGEGKTAWMVNKIITAYFDGENPVLIVANAAEKNRLVDLICERLQELHKSEHEAHTLAERMVVPASQHHRMRGWHPTVYVDELGLVLAQLLGRVPEAVTVDGYAYPLVFAPKEEPRGT